MAYLCQFFGIWLVIGSAKFEIVRGIVGIGWDQRGILHAMRSTTAESLPVKRLEGEARSE